MRKLEMPVKEAADLIGITPACLRERIRDGYYPEWAKIVKPKNGKVCRFIIVREKFNAYWRNRDA